MCLIIQREPHFEIPYKKFETSILNNPDGYGLSFPDDKGLEVFRTAEKPDPEKLYRMVNEELIDKHLMLHLRYTTAGETNLRNTHPFPILERNVDGIDLRMAHNGTLYPYKTKAMKGESDTRCFVRTYVRPLFKRLIKGMDAADILLDPFVKELLEGQLSTSSVLTFIDGDGNKLNCNPTGNGGKQEEGWYYSNVYSFKESHRVKKTSTAGGTTRMVSSGTGTKGASAGTNTVLFTDAFKIKDQLSLIHLTDPTIAEICKNPAPAEMLVKELLMINQKLQENIDKCVHENKQLKGATK